MTNINFDLSIDAQKIDNKLSGLNWITPLFPDDPEKEIQLLNEAMDVGLHSVKLLFKTKSGVEVTPVEWAFNVNNPMENIAESFSKGQRVIVHGRLKQDRWENENGENRQKVEITVEDAGHALKWATSVATKNDKSSSRPFEKPTPKGEPF